MSSVPRRNSKENSSTMDELCQMIRSGELDDDLIKLLEAINDRKDALKKKVDELVKAVYGEQAVVSQARPSSKVVSTTSADMTRAKVQSEDESASEADLTFPEPIVSGTVYERLNSGQGVTPEVLDSEMIDLTGMDELPPDLG